MTTKTEFLEEDAYEVYDSIKRVKNEIDKLIKKAIEQNHPEKDFGFGGTLYTSRAKKRLNEVEKDIYKFLEYQRASYKEAESKNKH